MAAETTKDGPTPQDPKVRGRPSSGKHEQAAACLNQPKRKSVDSASACSPWPHAKIHDTGSTLWEAYIATSNGWQRGNLDTGPLAPAAGRGQVRERRRPGVVGPCCPAQVADDVCDGNACQRWW